MRSIRPPPSWPFRSRHCESAFPLRRRAKCSTFHPRMPPRRTWTARTAAVTHGLRAPTSRGRRRAGRPASRSDGQDLDLASVSQVNSWPSKVTWPLSRHALLGRTVGRARGARRSPRRALTTSAGSPVKQQLREIVECQLEPRVFRRADSAHRAACCCRGRRHRQNLLRKRRAASVATSFREGARVQPIRRGKRKGIREFFRKARQAARCIVFSTKSAHCRRRGCIARTAPSASAWWRTTAELMS